MKTEKLPEYDRINLQARDLVLAACAAQITALPREPLEMALQALELAHKIEPIFNALYRLRVHEIERDIPDA